MDELSDTIQPQPTPSVKRKKWYTRWWMFIIYFIFGYVLIASSLLFFSNQEEDDEILKNVVTSTRKRYSDEDLYSHTDDDPTLGDKDAKVKIVEFSDFQCPICKEAFPTVREILNRYKNDVYYIYRDFPILEIHPDSLKAAEAGQCAHQQGKFWPMHDKIFINQENISQADLKKYAVEIGLDKEQFDNCLFSNMFLDEVQQDYQDGLKLGVIGTPTFFINGYKVPGNIPKDNFITIIEQAKLEPR